jgi:L-threonylcarbamoyladenylate synthase
LKTETAVAADGVGRAVEILASGGLVALPTETVYGLAADALDARACAGIFEAKGRPLSDPLIVHLPPGDWLGRICQPDALAMALAEEFWPGPLTMVLPRQAVVPDIVTAGQETVAVRCSAHPVFRETIEAFGRPLAAPSANRFGRISPTSAAHVAAELDGRIPLILDGGPCEHGLESTIVLVRDGRLEILRRGPVTIERLGEFAPTGERGAGVAVPGAMKSHYAPTTPLEIMADPRPRGPKEGLLAWAADGDGFAVVERPSPSLDLREAAANLYAALRRLDGAGLERIVAEPVPCEGLGAAIMDRLRKAAAAHR